MKADMSKRPFVPLAVLSVVIAFFGPGEAQAAPAPLRVLLITGGCCHDYAKQKDILKSGIEARAHAIVEQAHTDDSSTKPPLAILGNPDYAKGFDVIIHDECAADISDRAKVEGVLKPHLDGIPAVNLHCAMHSYRIGNPNEPATNGGPRALWFEYLGLQSSAHGAQLPIAIHFTGTEAPLTRGLADWTTGNEELYNNIRIFEGAEPLAKGTQVVNPNSDKARTNEFVVVWVNQYGPKKTKVFSTTIGHNNTTVQDDRYLDLVTRGLLWATGHVEKDGRASRGYGPGGK
jgi:hypothetical protein